MKILNKKRKILIVNAWAENRGDEAMINSLCKTILTSAPDSSIDVLLFKHNDLDVDRDVTIIKNRLGIYYYSSLTGIMRRLDKISCCYKIIGFIRQVLLILCKCLSCIELLLFMKYDLILNSPQGPAIGDMYNRFKIKEKTLHPLRLARKLHIPYAIMGVSMGPFEKKSEYEKSTFNILNSAKKIITREDISMSYVMQKYPLLKNIESSLDIVFSTEVNLEHKDSDCQDIYYEYCRILDRSAIGACISLTPAKRPDNAFNKKRYVSKMTCFFDYVTKLTNRRMILFPHLSFDFPILLKIKAMAKHSDKIIVFPDLFDSDFQQDLISKLSFYISSRYHPTIFAIKARIPFMCIKNQFKTEGMLKKLNIDNDTCWQDDSIDVFKRTFDACWAARERRWEESKKAYKLAKLEAEKYKYVLKQLLGDKKHEI